MNVQPIKTEGLVPPAKTKAQPAAAKPSSGSTPASAAISAGDRLEIESNDELVAAARQEPDVRPEVLNRAQSLVDDPSYPSLEILTGVARKLLSSK